MTHARSHPHPAPRPASEPSARRAFTLVELLVSIIILGIIMALLMVALRGANRAGRAAAERQNVIAMKMAVVEFKNRYGFAPPLIKDVKYNEPVEVVTDPGTGMAERRFNIYAATADDLRDLRRDNPQLAQVDERYSLVTLPYYLAGACEVRVTTTSGAAPIDGITGPGFLPPNPDGTYKLPAALKKPTAGASVTLAGRADPMVDAGKASLQLVTDLTLDATIGEPTHVAFHNRKGIGYRYYRWLPDARYPTASGTGAVSDTQYEDYYNIPIAVADWSAWKTHPPIRDARYAIVLPGEDGAFGDEEIDELASKMSVSPAPSSADSIRALRTKARADNIVEVGS